MPYWMELTVSFGVLVLAVLVMNRGNRFFINLKAQDEPVVLALGVFLLLVAADLGPIAAVIGSFFVALAIIARYTSLLDLKNVV